MSRKGVRARPARRSLDQGRSQGGRVRARRGLVPASSHVRPRRGAITRSQRGGAYLALFRSLPDRSQPNGTTPTEIRIVARSDSLAVRPHGREEPIRREPRSRDQLGPRITNERALFPMRRNDGRGLLREAGEPRASPPASRERGHDVHRRDPRRHAPCARNACGPRRSRFRPLRIPAESRSRMPSVRT